MERGRCRKIGRSFVEWGFLAGRKTPIWANSRCVRAEPTPDSAVRRSRPKLWVSRVVRLRKAGGCLLWSTVAARTRRPSRWPTRWCASSGPFLRVARPTIRAKPSVHSLRAKRTAHIEPLKPRQPSPANLMNETVTVPEKSPVGTSAMSTRGCLGHSGSKLITARGESNLNYDAEYMSEHRSSSSRWLDLEEASIYVPDRVRRKVGAPDCGSSTYEKQKQAVTSDSYHNMVSKTSLCSE